MKDISRHELFELFTKNTNSVSSPDLGVEYEEIQRQLNRPLRVKLGIDPTGPILHLGHCVVFERLRFLQDEGHSIIIIIGTFTAMIGDPSDKEAERIKLTREEIEINYKNYREQIGIILDLSKTTFAFNNEWFDKFDLENTLTLMSHVAVAKLLHRRDFKARLEHGLKMHELLYPLLQGYDSVAIKSDIEMGGADQLLNCTMGRSIQRFYGQQPQLVWTCPILTGLDGVDKMGKSLNNYIAINDPQMFSKIMSISDEVMFEYINYLLVTISLLVEQYKLPTPLVGSNLRHLKYALAHFITTRYLGQIEANNQRDMFDKISDIPIIRLPYADTLNIIDIIQLLMPNETRSSIRRIIMQGGCRIEDQVIKSVFYSKHTSKENELNLSVGKTIRVRILLI
jgi:tyrosyl-tRNA synthetase